MTNHRQEFGLWSAQNKVRILLTLGVILTVTVLIMLAMAGYRHHGGELTRIQQEIDDHASEIMKTQKAILKQLKTISKAQ